MSQERPPDLSRYRAVRIAHAYGNRRDALRLALQHPLDLIEADLHYRDEKIFVRHERRLGFLPLLYDRRSPGVRRIGPLAIPLGKRVYLRLDWRPIRLEELLQAAKGKRGLLLDIKGTPDPTDEQAFAEQICRLVREAGMEGEVILCGHWPLLEGVRQLAPQLPVFYTVESDQRWQALVEKLEAEGGVAGVCLYHGLLNAERARILAERRVETYCWTVDDWREAARLLEAGADGIISNDLELLGALTPKEGDPQPLRSAPAGD